MKKALLCMAAAVLIALPTISVLPGFWFDEGIIAGLAKNLALHGVYGTMVAPGEFFTNNYWITTSVTVTVPMAIVLKLFGVGVWQARFVPLTYLILFVGAAYLFVSRAFGKREAVWAGLLLVSFSPLYGNGKAVLGEVPGLFWFVVSCLLYLRYANEKSNRLLFWFGFCGALAIVTKPFYMLFAPAFAYLAVQSLRARESTYTAIGVALLGAAVPFVLWVYFTIGIDSIVHYQSTLSYFLNSYGASSFTPSIKANLLRFVTEGTPIHFLFLSTVIAIAAFRHRGAASPVARVSGAAMVFGVLALLWYLKTPGWYRYFFSIHVLALVFFPVAARALLKRYSVVLLVALVIFQSAYLAKHYNDFKSRETIEFSQSLEERLGAARSAHIVSHPEVAFLLNSANVSQYIYINDRLAVGAIEPSTPTDFVIAGRDDSAYQTSEADYLQANYRAPETIGHYLVYERK